MFCAVSSFFQNRLRFLNQCWLFGVKFEKDCLLFLLLLFSKFFQYTYKSKSFKEVCIGRTLGKGNKKQNFTGITNRRLGNYFHLPETAPLNKMKLCTSKPWFKSFVFVEGVGRIWKRTVLQFDISIIAPRCVRMYPVLRRYSYNTGSLTPCCRKHVFFSLFIVFCSYVLYGSTVH